MFIRPRHARLTGGDTSTVPVRSMFATDRRGLGIAMNANSTVRPILTHFRRGSNEVSLQIAKIGGEGM